VDAIAMSGSGDLAWVAPTAGRSPVSRRESALVRAAQRGSSVAMEELFQRHWAQAHRAAWLVVHDAAAAEDIAQEAFLRAIRALDSFDRRRPFGPWLHRIVVNRAIDHARSRALRREVVMEAPPSVGSTSIPSRDDELFGALAELPPEQRAVVVLRHMLGYSPGQVAEMLGLPRVHRASRLRRGLDSLAARLEEER
jgi:RNA polymerase sigma-70 factor, ECF subfamily